MDDDDLIEEHRVGTCDKCQGPACDLVYEEPISQLWCADCWYREAMMQRTRADVAENRLQSVASTVRCLKFELMESRREVARLSKKKA